VEQGDGAAEGGQGVGQAGGGREPRAPPAAALGRLPVADPTVLLGLDEQSHSPRHDGSWLPLWFGYQHASVEETPFYVTSRVMAAYRDLGRLGYETST
jgi:hypothetical protein